MLADGGCFIGGWFAGGVRSLLAAAGTAPWVEALLVDGVIAGVGGVLTFLPQIAILFLFLSFLEDSGYMARAPSLWTGCCGASACPARRLSPCSWLRLHRPGSHGSPHHGEREGPPHDHHAGSLYVLLRPAAVYGLLTAAFFPQYGAGGIFPLSAGPDLRHRLGHPPQEAGLPGEPAAFVLELPPYRLPTLKNIALHVWEKVKGFLVKAGT